MGYGVLRVDFETLKQALALPDDCQVIAVHRGDGVENAHADLVIACEAFPDTGVIPEKPLPLLTAICTQEVPPEHVCPDGFQCKRLSTTLEIRE